MKRFVLVDMDDQVAVDENVDLTAFFRLNDIHPNVANRIGCLPVGGEWLFGGGAAPLFALRREE